MSDLYYLVQNDGGKWEKADFYDMDNPIEALTKAYQKGRSDKYQEITSEYMLLTEKQVAEIRAEAIMECVKTIRNFAPDCVKLLEQLKEQKNE